ncbi:MAG: hypothetical protein ABIQ12_10490, partial [Opitutaceae bacterium]
MNFIPSFSRPKLAGVFAIFILTFAASRIDGQGIPASEATSAWTTAQDHANMLTQLGITKLRPGPSGRTGPEVTNSANYDPAKANPFTDLPELLVTKSG